MVDAGEGCIGWGARDRDLMRGTVAHLNMTDVKCLVTLSSGIDVDSANSLEKPESSESVCEACAIGKQQPKYQSAPI